MTPLELQRALNTMPSRAAQTLLFRCVEARTGPECAALYGIGLPQWEVLFLDAARALAGATAPLEDGARRELAGKLERALEAAAPPAEPDPRLVPLLGLVRALAEQREEVQRLLIQAERDAAASPARARERWLRRLAVVAIIAVSLFVWLRERDKAPPPARQFPLPPAGVR